MISRYYESARSMHQNKHSFKNKNKLTASALCRNALRDYFELLF